LYWFGVPLAVPVGVDEPEPPPVPFAVICITGMAAVADAASAAAAMIETRLDFMSHLPSHLYGCLNNVAL
jgi:hypothetical protein